MSGSQTDRGDVAALTAELTSLRAENARLLKLTRREATPPGPAQAGFFEAPPGAVHAGSPPEVKVAFFGALFAARTDLYAVRWENARTGQKGWLPAVRGGWRKGVPHAERDYLPLTAGVLSAHLSGQMHLGLYPLLEGDRCWWLAADFDGSAGMLDALNYIKAARALSVPAGLEVSRSGTGAHTWIFFTGPVPAETARRLGTGLLREAMALRGQMSLASYDRLFPSQDTLPVGGVGNLIAAPLYGKARRDGATVFLDAATMEPHFAKCADRGDNWRGWGSMTLSLNAWPLAWPASGRGSLRHPGHARLAATLTARPAQSAPVMPPRMSRDCSPARRECRKIWHRCH